MFSNTFLPIYSNSVNKYATIRIKRDDSKFNLKKLVKNDVYHINVEISESNYNSKTYVNVHLNHMKLIKKAPEIDLGKIIKFDILDSDEDSDDE